MTSSGGEAAADPFFAVVRRRHPDVDVVLLPPEPAADTGETRAAVLDRDDTDRVEADLDGGFQTMWSQITVGLPDPTGAPRWSHGPREGTLRREAVLAVTGVGAVAAHETLARAERELHDAGWHVHVPPTGMPRVLAGRDDASADAPAAVAEVELVWVERGERVALSVRSSPVLVGEGEARRRVGDR